MAPKVRHVESDSHLPAEVDVAIIGGGIIGISTALFLQQKGIRTLVCEKGYIAAEQSSRNWGWCRKTGRDPREIPLIVESLRLWEKMNEITGAETGFRPFGIAQLCFTEADLAKCQGWLEEARAYNLDSRFVPPKDVPNIVGPSTLNWRGAVYSPTDGKAEPTLATPAMADAVRRLGGVIVTSCAVRGFETQGGRVTSVVTEKGSVRCQSIVLAGGVWSRLFCQSVGIDLPQLKVMTSVLRTKKIDGGPDCAAIGPGFAFRKTSDGSYIVSQAHRNLVDIGPDNFLLFREFLPALADRWKTIKLQFGKRAWVEWTTPRRWALDRASPFESNRVMDPEPYKPFLDEALENCTNAFPSLRGAQVAESWGGLLDVTPDVVPVISSVDAIPGFFVATGFSGHGFGIAPGAGKLMADLVTGDTPVVDPKPFRLSRYRDKIYPRPSPVAM